MSETTHRAVRLALASLLAVALTAQFIIGVTDSELTLTDFFSYFTVLSNTAAVIMLAMLARRPGWDSSGSFATLRGAVTVYMSVTGVAYLTILYPQLVDVGVPEPWIDLSIHVVGPLLVTLDWLLYPPPIQLPSRTVSMWLIFPAAYLVYSLVRGPIAGWYPYPFLNPTEQGGYVGVAVWSLIVLTVILGLIYFFYRWGNRRLRQAEPA